ncbi:FecR domain-containing protein [uncultured Erythrobacter sp.]|uniref:FecR family protein n=1 Tax=uncultured Erythrobacter sp. TaxID=263913 RepID=UPI00261CDC6B|nr:FecR domain-containing protein [uncultured Erythrobacter sp.]
MRKVSFLIAAIAALVVQPAAAQSAGEEIGRVKNVTSGVEVTRDGRTYRAVSGMRLVEDDVIVTRRAGRVGITFIDNTRMAIGPNSEVTLDEYRYDRARQTGRSTTFIRRGTVGIDSGNITRTGRDRMRVRTPTSTLGVRGTTFVVEVG